MTERGTLEIQAYDRRFFPGLRRNGTGPPPSLCWCADACSWRACTDDEVVSWIAAGKPPIYFGFGSTPVQSPAETVAMIADACAELGERALIYSAPAAAKPLGIPTT